MLRMNLTRIPIEIRNYYAFVAKNESHNHKLGNYFLVKKKKKNPTKSLWSGLTSNAAVAFLFPHNSFFFWSAVINPDPTPPTRFLLTDMQKQHENWEESDRQIIQDS